MPRTKSRLAVAGLIFTGCLHTAIAQDVLLQFEGSGDETGVTDPGVSEFDFMGSSWSGGVIASEGQPRLYASGVFSYEVIAGQAAVSFAEPVTRVRFFYVHGGGFPAGTAAAMSADGVVLETLDSNAATVFADSSNFVTFATTAPIAAIEFSGGVIDDFSYRTAADVFDFALAEGSWVNADPAFVGERQGILFDYGPTLNALFMAWFTYTLNPIAPSNATPTDVGSPGHRWMTALLSLDGNRATGTVSAGEGGQFAAPPTGFQRGRERGTFTVEFTACDHGIVTYAIDAPQVSGEFEIIPLEKLVNPNGFECG